MEKAPGAVMISIVRFYLGANPYELGNETRALLSTITGGDRPIIFTGWNGSRNTHPVFTVASEIVT